MQNAALDIQKRKNRKRAHVGLSENSVKVAGKASIPFPIHLHNPCSSVVRKHKSEVSQWGTQAEQFSSTSAQQRDRGKYKRNKMGKAACITRCSPISSSGSPRQKNRKTINRTYFSLSPCHLLTRSAADTASSTLGIEADENSDRQKERQTDTKTGCE